MSVDGVSEEPTQEFSKWEMTKGWIFLIFAAGALVVGLWWLLFTPNNSKVFVIQGVNDDCFRKLEMSSYNGPDEWSMKVCISANNGYVDENGKVIHP